MSYIGLTLPRKPKRRGRITQLQESSIYSTLSKKPADLKTTDIDLSAIRVFLSDGSHRTISCTPTTTCGEILARLLGKLGLSEGAQEYALQIKYTYSEPRLADESEKISELNQHVWDSVDRIHLFWKTDSPPPIMRRKRLKSFEGTLSKEESKRICENFAVLSQHVEPDTEPVVVNDTLAKSFAVAWNTGSDLYKAGKRGEHKPLQSIPFQPTYENTKAKQLSPQAERKHSYTLNRKPKDPTIRRRLPVGMSPRQSPTTSPRPTRKRIGSPQDKTDNNTLETSPILQVYTHTTSEGTTTRARSVSPEQPASSRFNRGGNGRRCLRRPSPKYKAANKGNVAAKNFSFSRNKSLSEACLLTASNREETATAHTQDRDSGFDEIYRSCHLSTNDLRSPSQPPSPRKKTVSLENFPVPSLAKYTIKAPLTKTRSLEGTSRQRVTTKVKFLEGISGIADQTDQLGVKSVESCDNEAVNTVASNSSTGPHSIVPSTPPNHHPPQPPIVPQRTSAYLQNCTVPDDYLLKQGKRISQMLNLTPKKEESRTFKSLQAAFSKVGTLLKKGRATSLAENSPQSSPSPTKKPLGFPDSPTWKTDQSPTSTTPQPKQEQVNSMGVRWSCVEYAPVSIGDNQRPVLAKNVSKLSLSKTSLKVIATQQQTEGLPICKLLSDPQCLLPTSTVTTSHTMAKQDQSSTLNNTNDLLSATPESDMEGHFAKTVPHEDEDEQFDIAVPVPIPPKEPKYLKIVAHAPAGVKQSAPMPPHTYENSEFDPRGEHIYETLPSCHRKSKLSTGEPPQQKYENQKIESVSTNRITFEGSPLHVYQAFPSVSSEALLKGIPLPDGYVNQEIHPTQLDGIAFAGGDLHVYHVPGQPIVPPPSLPPRSSNLTHSLPLSPSSPPPLLPNLNQSHQLLQGEAYSSESDPTSLGQLQPVYPDKTSHGFTQLQLLPEVPGYSKLHSYVGMHNTSTGVTLTNPTKAANGKTYRSWSTPVENPGDELQQKLEKRAALLHAANTETQLALPPQNAPSPPTSKTKPLPHPPPKPKSTSPPLSKLSSAIPPHEKPIFVPPPPPPFPPETESQPTPPFLPATSSSHSQVQARSSNSKATIGPKITTTTRPAELFNRFDQPASKYGQR